MATVTFALGLLADVSSSPQLFRAKNVCSVATTPLEVLVSVLYWGISAIDKRLVVPEWAQLAPMAAYQYQRPQASVADSPSSTGYGSSTAISTMDGE
ncbi:hypothetical protein GP486_002930 [Trichoglossum hirsutum]|uniref:Uncharacterized protein n=1 Tax=Trichoglossum hirsutum TaxID=265104 RepID=A0A9P8RRM4_9PEZI|nr:hypothetical protein GP486_002930 [Trichoglossum hirsutum]